MKACASPERLLFRGRKSFAASFICWSVFVQKYLLSVQRMHMSRGGWHTDLCLGWQPVVRAALAAGSWETGGRHPNVITAAKLLSIKYKLQKYAPWGLPKMKTEAHLSGFSPSEQRSWCFPCMLTESLLIHSRLTAWLLPSFCLSGLSHKVQVCDV